MSKLYQNFRTRIKYLLITWFLFIIILIFLSNKSKYEVTVPLVENGDFYFSNYKDSDFITLFENENENNNLYGPIYNLTPLGSKNLINDLNFLNTINLNLITEEAKELEFKFYGTYKIMAGSGKALFGVNLRLIYNEKISKEKIINTLNTISDNIQNTIRQIKISEHSKLVTQTKEEIENNVVKMNNYESLIKIQEKSDAATIINQSFIEIKSQNARLNGKLNKLNKEIYVLKNINKKFNLFNSKSMTAAKKINGVNISLIYLIIFIIFFSLNYLIISRNRNFLNFRNKIF
jgi:hypothetical protein